MGGKGCFGHPLGQFSPLGVAWFFFFFFLILVYFFLDFTFKFFKFCKFFFIIILIWLMTRVKF
jgi:hypothetical protein